MHFITVTYVPAHNDDLTVYTKKDPKRGGWAGLDPFEKQKSICDPDIKPACKEILKQVNDIY